MVTRLRWAAEKSFKALVFLLSETGFRRHQLLWLRQVKIFPATGWKPAVSDRR
jgi:IS4 transposase